MRARPDSWSQVVVVYNDRDVATLKIRMSRDVVCLDGFGKKSQQDYPRSQEARYGPKGKSR